MIDWIDDYGKTWGVAKRRIVLGGYWYENDGFHRDGFSARSVVGKLWDEREAAGQGARKQRAIEVFTGDALSFEIGMENVAEHWFYLAHYRYVVPKRWVPVKTLIRELKEMFPKKYRDERAYYDQIHDLHCYLMGRIPDVSRETKTAQEMARA